MGVAGIDRWTKMHSLAIWQDFFVREDKIQPPPKKAHIRSETFNFYASPLQALPHTILQLSSPHPFPIALKMESNLSDIISLWAGYTLERSPTNHRAHIDQRNIHTHLRTCVHFRVITQADMRVLGMWVEAFEQPDPHWKESQRCEADVVSTRPLHIPVVHT